MAARTSKWVAFFNRAAVWKALLIIVGYLVVYLGIGFIVGKIAGSDLDLDNVLDSPSSILVGLTIPIALGALVLIWFGKSVGWLKSVFGKQPIGGKKWMWIAPILVVTSIVLHLLSADYGAFSATSILLLAVTGLCIGVAEELITRGYVVKMLRDAGKSEWVVMILSSLLFGLMHGTNLLGGQKLSTTLIQIAFAFGFGVCMYLTLRVTGSLVFPIILHAFYDPSLFFATGGINRTTQDDQTGLAALAGIVTLMFLIFAFLSLFFVRGRVGGKARANRSA